MNKLRDLLKHTLILIKKNLQTVLSHHFVRSRPQKTILQNVMAELIKL